MTYADIRYTYRFIQGVYYKILNTVQDHAQRQAVVKQRSIMKPHNRANPKRIHEQGKGQHRNGNNRNEESES